MKVIRWLKRPVVLISASALVFAIIVGAVTFFIMRAYQAFQPIWVEQAAYGQWPMAKFQSVIQEQGLVAAIGYSLVTDDILVRRHLLEIWMLGILAPETLGWFQSPLLVVMPIFVVFLGLLGWTVYTRSGNIIYSLASMMLFCALAQLTRHDWGIGSGFADWQALFLLSSAVLSLINAIVHPKLDWIRASAVFLALTVLSRLTAVFYVVVICGPILVIYLIVLYRRTYSVKQIVVTVMNVVLIMFPIVVLVIWQLPSLLSYYGSASAWQLSRPFLESANNMFLELLGPFVGMPFILCCLVFLGLNIWQVGTTKKGGSEGLVSGSDIAILWWGLGFLGFLLVKGYTSDVPKEVMYAVPAILLGCVSIFSGTWLQHQFVLNWASIPVIIFSIASFSWHSYQNAQLPKKLTVRQEVIRNVQIELANQLSQLPQDITWQSYTSVDWGIPVSLITLYRYGEFHESLGGYFHNSKPYWDRMYPSTKTSELQERLYAQTSDCIDIAIILKDPDQQPSSMEDYSYSIAAFISRRIQTDDAWEKLSELNGWPEETKYAIYRNKHPLHSISCTN